MTAHIAVKMSVNALGCLIDVVTLLNQVVNCSLLCNCCHNFVVLKIVCNFVVLSFSTLQNYNTCQHYANILPKKCNPLTLFNICNVFILLSKVSIILLIN